MQKPILFFLLICLSIQTDFLSYYPYGVVTTATYQCIKQSGEFKKIAVWVQSTGKGIDPNSIQNLINANNAGFQVDIWLTPCRGRDAVSEAAVIKSMGKLFQKVWIYPQRANERACSWFEFSGDSNCDYLQQLVNEISKDGIKVGIIGQREHWVGTFGRDDACPQVSNSELFWEPWNYEIDREPNFNNYRKIGGWVSPSAKLYEYVFVCQGYVSKVYYP